MKYRIELKPSVADALAKIPKAHRQRIAKRIGQLADDPRPAGAQKLAGVESLYRIRLSDYRVIYQVNDNVLLVLVVRISSRCDVYRHLP
jgi:mRNA interferase RelE/StbE